MSNSFFKLLNIWCISAFPYFKIILLNVLGGGLLLYCFEVIINKEIKKDQEYLANKYMTIIANYLIDEIEDSYFQLKKGNVCKINKNDFLEYEPFIININSTKLYCNNLFVLEKIDNLITDYLYYYITIDNISLNSRYFDHEEDIYQKSFKFIDNKVLDVKVHFNNRSENIKDIHTRKSEKRKLSFFIVFGTGCITTILSLLYNNKIYKYKLLQISHRKKQSKLNSILESLSTKHSLMKRFYKSDTLQISINSYNYSKIIKNDNSTYLVSFEYILPLLEILVKGYSGSNDIHIKFMYSNNVKNIESPCSQELLEQILYSIVSNILTFMKSKKTNYYINIMVNKQNIQIIFNGFELDNDLIQHYCTRIFDELQDPTCSSLNDVIHVLEKMGIIMDSNYSVKENVIKLSIPSANKNLGKIINIKSKKSV